MPTTKPGSKPRSPSTGASTLRWPLPNPFILIEHYERVVQFLIGERAAAEQRYARLLQDRQTLTKELRTMAAAAELAAERIKDLRRDMRNLRTRSGKLIQCPRCPAWFDRTGSRSKHCPVCRPLVQKEKDHQRWVQKTEQQRFDRNFARRVSSRS